MSPRIFLMFFSLQFIQYLNITLDYRAVAHNQYWVVAVTNVLAPCLSWLMVVFIKKETNNWWGMLAVALGGASSALLGMWITRSWG